MATHRPKDRYLKLLHISAEEAWDKVSELASNLTGPQHKVRSAIIDLHYVVEIELRRMIFHCLKGLILYRDKADREQKTKKLEEGVGALSFGQMMRLLQFFMSDDVWPSLQNVPEINKTRNQIAHRGSIDKVLYKGRSPFKDPDAFAEMFFDVWAMQKEFEKWFDRTIEEPMFYLREYRKGYEKYKKKFGPLNDPDIRV